MLKDYDIKSCEEKWRNQWTEKGIYRFDPVSNRPIFSIDTPPPYVSSDELHAGHIMSYVQAEVIARFRRMQGFNVFYPIGFDDNGLPTERYVERKYKIKKIDANRSMFIDLCKTETEKGAKNYREILERVAISVDWSLTYNTIGERAQRIAQKSFLELFRLGLVYRKNASALWCPKCHTALAQADVETTSATGDNEPASLHERCGTQVEVRETMQWFINLLDHKQEFLQRGKELEWFPAFMQERYIHWVDGLEWDWCISRDRFYGVPIPAWICKECGGIVLPNEDMLPIDPRDNTPDHLCCTSCGSHNLQPEQQVLDTWMTSSLTPFINARWGETDHLMRRVYPMSLRIQAFEIIRTWLFYTIVKSHYHTDTLPWTAVMISGWGLDDNGQKMSKSLGNFVAAKDLLNRHSADAIRWWATGASLGQNLRFSEKEVRDGRKVILKLWNASLFVSTILERHNSSTDLVPICNFSDKWILAELQKLIACCTESMVICEYNRARTALEKFFWILFCDNYLELCKDRSWHPEKYTEQQLQSMTWTLSYVLNTLLRLFAPFLPYVTEEIYHQVFSISDERSIHVAVWPIIDETLRDDSMVTATQILIDLIGKVRYFKGEVLHSHRAPLLAISIHTDNTVVAQAIADLAGLSGAKEGFVNKKIHGTEYVVGDMKLELKEL